MGTKALFMTIALAAAPLAAHADADWKFAITGAGLFADGGTEGCSPDHPEQCVRNVDWSGSVTFVTASGEDGVYDAGYPIDGGWHPGGIIRMILQSNVGDSDIDAQASPGSTFLPGVYPYAITVAGGHVTDIQWTSEERPDALGFFQVAGFAASYDTNSYHGTFAHVSGLLTAVPEPGSLALSLLGLVAVATGLRRRAAGRTQLD